jgi:hypothetical protein
VRDALKDRVIIVLAVLLVALVAAELVFAPHARPTFPWHRVPGYSALIGLFSSLLIVQLSKWLGRLLLQRPDRDDD